MLEAEVFNSNLIYVYFLSCIVIFSYRHFLKCQKISLIYATTIAMEIISQCSWGLTLGMLFIFMFILEEYLSDDIVKCELLRNLWYKMVDFIYQFFFIDAGLCIIINIIISDQRIRDFLLQKGMPLGVFYGINIFILLITIHILNTSKFSLYDFKDIKKYFDEIENKKINWNSSELQRRFNVMLELEDKSYFDRTNSYNWISVEFVKYKIKEYKLNKEWRKQFNEGKTLVDRLQHMWRLMRNFELIRYSVGRIKEVISGFVWSINETFRRLKGKIRGCSTLEMQLIRNIGIQKGYDKCVMRRKFFEFFYTYLFFNGLKRYYDNTQNNLCRELKKAILCVYLYSIRVSMFGNNFKTIDKLFQAPNIEDWDIDEFYIAILSLTGAPVTHKRMVLYPNAINILGINLNRALVWRNMIKDFRITEKNKECFNEDEVKPVFYVIQGSVLPCIEQGIFYGPNDGIEDWPSYPKGYWDFARMVYWHIWKERFSNKTGTDDDMMQLYHSLEERTITVEHCQRYLGTAEPGAVIRMSEELKGNDKMGGKGHSQILLSKDNSGVTIYESDDQNTRIRYYTWSQYVEEYKKYKYFKYIKWPTYINKV